MLALRHYFQSGNEIGSVINGVEAGLKEQLIAGLTGSARTLFVATLYERTKRPQLVVTHNLFQAQNVYEDLVELVGSEHVYLYPVNDLISSEIAIASPELKAQRLQVLLQWVNNPRGIVVSPIAGLKRMIAPKSTWEKMLVHLRVGENIDIEALLHKLIASGYSRTPMVSTPGEFSMRGGIIDVYPLTEEQPIRIELFDTEIDSIRFFDVESQRSDKKVEFVTVGPASEVPLFPENFEYGIEQLQSKLKHTLQHVKNKSVKEKIDEQIGFELEKLNNQEVFQGIYKYISLFFQKPESLLDYFPNDGIVIFDETSRVQEVSQQLDKEEAEWQTTLLEQGETVTDLTMSWSFDALFQPRTQQKVHLTLFLRHIPHTNPENVVNANSKSMQQFHGQMNVLKTEIERWKKANYAIAFLAADEERAKRIERIMNDYKIEVQRADGTTPLISGVVQILTLPLATGFELPIERLAVVTEEEIFSKNVRKQRRREKMSNAERIKSYSELNVGDYIVHVNHGIGKYLGIETLEINGVHKDYLHVKYAGNDTLYVPVDQIDQIQKYVGSEAKVPKVHSLGGSDWKRTKKRVQSSVEDIADDLIKLYAEREASKGVQFEKDGEEQREFEASFPYEETADQLRAIEEIKADMEKVRPMDRLLCGDVGYGKTEVALRAVFKAIMSGKQVAILVPTTILAQQHYETMRERFSEHPINIAVLSRFRTRKQQTETIKGLKNGTIDVVVGTHRLLSKDITFLDLGLLVVDEEQRFGVKHKEKIKQMKANIDVLTLTATPIPRTLHMSLLGVRDLSVIETPPENRFPVQTYVVEYNATLIREAIERELARNGQVYFLYNRVETIERMTEQIRMLVPEARVAFAHGQMTEGELENVMLDFLDGQYDVLVSTTIIETGVDIPNVNTLIVYGADKMGLSQLYQLRGRVGRSNRVAYAYFTYQRDKLLSEVAEKRLQAIKEFTELGSGFKIAMRDLSIRGAGNLLGAEQHGFIDSVGFDLYSQMLKEAIEERKGVKEIEQPFTVEIDLQMDAYIPSAYISDEYQKIDMYKRFRALETDKDIQDLEDELIDRFGDYPDEVALLLAISRMKSRATDLKIESIKENNREFVLLFSEKAADVIDNTKLFQIISSVDRRIHLGTVGNQVKIVLRAKGESDRTACDLILTLLQKLMAAKKAEKTSA
ncbi:transcription-repair coupling factor [Pueribacillus sp. YX66]|uniref:transcription-repair coupling factor n=1 Tax=Pueribacillus sp. YX66 TaxID=3229242 RepID=UPI00358D4D11